MIYLLLIVLAVGILFYAVIVSKSAPTRSARHGRVDKNMVASRWQTITQMAAGGGNGLRTAVSEADKLFDHVLRESGYRGNTMADRLRSAKGSFSNYQTYDALWQAHKLRNALAHEVGFDLVKSHADEALYNFERGLKELDAL